MPIGGGDWAKLPGKSEADVHVYRCVLDHEIRLRRVNRRKAPTCPVCGKPMERVSGSP
jgi:tRNA(Ile2) C34 agmatinyltransferase TiaS